MKKKFEIKGIKKITDNINKELDKMKGKAQSDGFMRVAMAVYQEMEYGSRKIPLDTGNLRASYFAAIKGSNGGANLGNGYVQNIKRTKKDTQHQQMVVSAARSAVQAQPYPNMIFGFAANYAFYVHEDLQAKGKDGVTNWQREGSGPKFFEIALRAKENEIIEILKDSIKL